jgi:hypothetical protein
MESPNQTEASPMRETLSPSGRYCGDFTVARIEMPSVEAFDRDYARIGKPVIITNLLRRTRAGRKWTPDYLIETIGQQEITLTKLRNRKLRSNNTLYRVAFADYAAAAFIDDPEARQYCVQQIDLPDAIAGDFPTPELVGSWLRVRPRFWLSTPGHVTETHRDAHHNLLAQVIGTKKLTLFSPVFSHALYSHHPHSSLAGYSRVDMDRPDFSRFPGARELTPTEVTLRAGEALFLPVYWWHRVETLEVSVSVNCWWAPPLNLSLLPQFTPRGTPEETFQTVHALADLSSFPSEFDVVEYLWSEGFPLLSAAYLHHCVAILLAAASPGAADGGQHPDLVRAARKLARSGILNCDDTQTIESILLSCRGAVESMAGSRRPPRRHGIADMASLVTAARRVAANLGCEEHFRPARWVPGRPADD